MSTKAAEDVAEEIVDATLVDESPAITHTSRELVRGVTHEVIRPLDTSQVLESMRAHQELLRQILDPSDWQGTPDAKGSFVKKSGWRKVALSYNLSMGRVGEEVERDEDGSPLRATYTAWAEAPNGRRVEATGHCAESESRFTKQSGRQKLENDMRATAETRAKNRAISDLIGMGKVSAEEVDAGAAADVPEHGVAADDALQQRMLKALAYLLDDEVLVARAFNRIGTTYDCIPQASAEAVRMVAGVLKLARDEAAQEPTTLPLDAAA